jgi:hypothetical protein
MSRPVRDQRKHARFEMFEYAQMYREADLAEEGANSMIVDISIGGAQIRSRTRYVEGETCSLVIGRGWEPPTKVTVEVRYSKPVEDSDLFATGFRFKPKDPKERMDLVDFLHEVFQRTADSTD